MDWLLRARALGLREHWTADVVLRRRLHRANQGRRQRVAVTDYARILKDHLYRSRARKVS